MATETLTVAIELYDRHVPLFMGIVPPPDGVDLRYLEVGVTNPGRDGTNRHERMLHDEAFDVAELSLAAYIIAKSRGSAMTAVPVFPRRLFSQNHIFIRNDSGIREPADLAEKRVAIRAFQVTMTVLARGDLKSEYNVRTDDIIWVTQRPEHLDFDAGKLRVEPIPPGKSRIDLLLAGEVDAMIDPGAPVDLLNRHPAIGRLFVDPRGTSIRYFRRRGYYPLMHVLALKPGIAERFPVLPTYLVHAFDEARGHARKTWEDFAFSHAPFGRLAYDDDARHFGSDPWPSGLAPNRRAIEDFIGYLLDQRLITRTVEPEELFHPSTLAA